MAIERPVTGFKGDQRSLKLHRRITITTDSLSRRILRGHGTAIFLITGTLIVLITVGLVRGDGLYEFLRDNLWAYITGFSTVSLGGMTFHCLCIAAETSAALGILSNRKKSIKVG